MSEIIANQPDSGIMSPVEAAGILLVSLHALRFPETVSMTTEVLDLPIPGHDYVRPTGEFIRSPESFMVDKAFDSEAKANILLQYYGPVGHMFAAEHDYAVTGKRITDYLTQAVIDAEVPAAVGENNWHPNTLDLILPGPFVLSAMQLQHHSQKRKCKPLIDFVDKQTARVKARSFDTRIA